MTIKGLGLALGKELLKPKAVKLMKSHNITICCSNIDISIVKKIHLSRISGALVYCCSTTCMHNCFPP